MNKHTMLTSLSIILFFVLTACQKDPDWTKSKNQEDIPSFVEGITIKFEKEKYKTNVTEAKLVLHNDCEKTFLYGERYLLEKNVNGTWYEVPLQEGMAFTDIGYYLDPHQTKFEMISLNIFEEKLSPGHYRITKDFSDTKKEYSPENQKLIAASFELIEP